MFRLFGILGSKNKNSSELEQSIINLFGFKPKNIDLYKLAFLHRSAKIEKDGHEISNERLEFLGDAVIDTIVAEYLFKKFPYSNEGELTQMRSKIVSRNSLNNFAAQIGLSELVNINKNQIAGNKSYRGNAFEAFFGAVFLDKGYEFSRKLLVNNLFSLRIDIENVLQTETNFKSKLLEWSQKQKKEVVFNKLKMIGYGRGKQYMVEVLIDNVSYGEGTDYCLKGAEQNASEVAVQKLQIL